jgi:hypothetical protein
MPSVGFRKRGNNLKERAPHLGLGFWIDEVEGVGTRERRG